MEQLMKKIKITTTIELITGLHIGGGNDKVEIGGIDNPVIRVGTKDAQPYIPGSSLKGKMRCLLEQIKGSPNLGGNDGVNDLFGFIKTDKTINSTGRPSKLIVRDAYLQEKSVKELQECENLDSRYTESKWENVIDRVEGTAKHPRQMERVPAGVFFNAEFIINVWDNDGNGEKLVALLEEGIEALENDYLGGSGSRGYGQIRFGERIRKDITFDK